MDARGGPVEVTFEATVIRADGTREELGVVSYYHRRWWRRALWRIGQTLNRS